MKILIAEDDTVSRLLLEATLKKLGHDVVCCQDGREAWTFLRKEHHPVLISDWQMPQIDGLMLCRELRKTQHDQYTYIVLLTALGGKANYLEAIAAGADDFITKPFDEEQLAARLQVAERILGLRQHVSQLEGLLPICSQCKKICSDESHWQQIESYVSQRSDARFSHTICPDCLGVPRAQAAA
jgi:sigma-B regulation protein RsbU (phosphoserine phosphatase)